MAMIMIALKCLITSAIVFMISVEYLRSTYSEPIWLHVVAVASAWATLLSLFFLIWSF